MSGGIRCRRHGFTVMEVTIAALLGLGLVGGISSLLVSSSRAVSRSDERLDARESAVLGLSAIRRALEDARGYAILEEGRTLVFLGPQGRGELRLDEEGTLQLTPGDGAEPRRIGGLGAGFRVTERSPGLITIDLGIERPVTSGGEQPPPLLVLTDEVTLRTELAATPDTLSWNPLPSPET